MIKIKLSEVVQSTGPLQELFNMKLPIYVGYKIAKIKDKADQETKLYNVRRMEIIKEFGELTDKKTDTWTVKKENIEEFNKKIEELNDIPVSLLDVDKIKIKELGEIVIEPRNLPPWLFEE